MKWNRISSLSIITSLAILLPATVFAEDQNQDEKKPGKKESKGQQHGGKPSQKPSTPASATSAGKSHGGQTKTETAVNNASEVKHHASHSPRESAPVQQSNVAPASSRSSHTSSRVGTSQTQVYSSRQQNTTEVSYDHQRYNKGNNYGGLWSSADAHRDWNRDSEHSWNHHHYRWYDGGWLIIDSGFSPYSQPVYSTGGSVGRSVQIRLAEQGYYRGPVDGDIGPGTRNAIAGYQNDHDLRVTGHINDALLQSLGLE